MNKVANTIFIVDDDQSVRRSLSLFLSTYDYIVETFGSSEEFLEREPFSGTGCLILDINLEGKSGIELQDILLEIGSNLPIIFISGNASIRVSVQTLKKGAVNFLEKPFGDEELLQSIAEAIALSKKLKTGRDEVIRARRLIDNLTLRELEILKHIMSGMLNKQIASILLIAEHTVKLHRHSICEKLGVKSLPEIISIANKAGIEASEKIY
jgi:FixJ family two-component response regulator